MCCRKKERISCRVLRCRAVAAAVWFGLPSDATSEQLGQVIAEAFAAISSRDANGWFAHAGYRIGSK
jgi:hypothetical protein